MIENEDTEVPYEPDADQLEDDSSGAVEDPEDVLDDADLDALAAPEPDDVVIDEDTGQGDVEMVEADSEAADAGEGK